MTARLVRPEALGRTVESGPLTVTAPHIRAYAEATSDPEAAASADRVAPFAFAIVPVFALFARCATGVVDDSATAVFLHGEHALTQRRRLRPGDVVTGRCAVVGLRRTPAGALVVTRTTTESQDGELVNEQISSTLIRSHQVARSVGIGFADDAMPRDVDTGGACVVQTFDRDQTYRYAEASGDHARIHLDHEVARAAGLPGIIIHGLCTFAFAARAASEALCPDDHERLQALTCRFVAPARPGDTMVTTFDTGEGPERGFRSTIDAREVLAHGVARLVV